MKSIDQILLWQHFSSPLKAETLLAFRPFHAFCTFSQNYQIFQSFFFLCFSIELMLIRPCFAYVFTVLFFSYRGIRVDLWCQGGLLNRNRRPNLKFSILKIKYFDLSFLFYEIIIEWAVSIVLKTQNSHLCDYFTLKCNTGEEQCYHFKGNNSIRCKLKSLR